MSSKMATILSRPQCVLIPQITDTRSSCPDVFGETRLNQTRYVDGQTLLTNDRILQGRLPHSDPRFSSAKCRSCTCNGHALCYHGVCRCPSTVRGQVIHNNSDGTFPAKFLFVISDYWSIAGMASLYMANASNIIKKIEECHQQSWVVYVVLTSAWIRLLNTSLISASKKWQYVPRCTLKRSINIGKDDDTTVVSRVNVTKEYRDRVGHIDIIYVMHCFWELSIYIYIYIYIVVISLQIDMTHSDTVCWLLLTRETNISFHTHWKHTVVITTMLSSLVALCQLSVQ